MRISIIMAALVALVACGGESEAERQARELNAAAERAEKAMKDLGGFAENMLESRAVADASAAATNLKSGVFPGLVVYQSGGYTDADGDAVGEYPPDLMYLAGATGNGQAEFELSLLGNDWNQPDPVSTGNYLFALELGEDPEKHWCAIAWPTDNTEATAVYAISQLGKVITRERAEDEIPNAKTAWKDANFIKPADGWVEYKRR